MAYFDACVSRMYRRYGRVIRRDEIVENFIIVDILYL